MFDNMRRLHPRGAANRGICVDIDGAMLGPDCVLVDRTQHGFRPLNREQASALQKCVLGAAPDEEWLFRQCHRISDALNKGEMALAQIHGLYIPVEKLDDRTLHRLALINIDKGGFNPDEPRIPKGEPHAGEWTTGSANQSDTNASDGSDDGFADGDQGGGEIGTGEGGRSEEDDPAALTPSLTALADDNGLFSTDTLIDDGRTTSDDNLPAGLEMAPATAATSPDEPAMQYQIFGTASVAAADAAAASLLSGLSPQVLAALAQLLARMTGPTAFLGVLFIPSNGGLVATGAVAGAPDLTVSYNRDTGVVQVWQANGAGGQALLDTGHIGVDGRFYDTMGTAIGAAIANGAVIDPSTLPGYRIQSDAGINTDTRAQAVADTANEPKLCPDPTPESTAGRSDRTIAYQAQITGLPPGLEIVFNGERYDGCDPITGHLLEAKGEGYADKMSGRDAWQKWFTGGQDLEEQMESHSQNALGRTVEYHFAEKAVADWARGFAIQFPNITVFYTPRVRQ